MIGMIIEDYKIIELIGTGGMAKVFLAEHTETGEAVAIKTLPEEFYGDETYEQRFSREIEVVSRFDHPNILQLLGYGEQDNISYIIMPYMSYGTLQDLLDDKPLPPEECLRLLRQLGSAIDHAHEQQAIHRDIKPVNVMLDANSDVKLLDFGVAKLIEDTSVDITGSAIVGTWQYMSPEQCMGEKDLTPQTDIYALGIVLHQMLTGRSPFHTHTAAEIVHRHMSASISMADDLDEKLSPELKFVILKALARKPSQRHKSGKALVDAFQRVLPKTK